MKTRYWCAKCDEFFIYDGKGVADRCPECGGGIIMYEGKADGDDEARETFVNHPQEVRNE
ncbi:hypothetical protein LCGC14_0611040 [marine sediment metagenome]|uniref:Uncharacterized protein n=1 Tax=marine sediment metagenome TaxID=412755 RepID=A0A0F9RRT6_9ZZZZ